MKTYRVEIKGVTPLLQHRMPEEELFALLGAKTQKKKDKEDQTQRQIAEKYVYKTKDGQFYVPAEHVTGAVSFVASDYKQKNSIRKSLKQILKGAVMPSKPYGIITCHKGKPLKDFEVDVRKATNHQKGAVAVCRPRFDEWKTEIELSIQDELVSPETLLEMLNDAGKRSGIGSFRVQRGGYFGQFQITKFEEIKN